MKPAPPKRKRGRPRKIQPVVPAPPSRFATSRLFANRLRRACDDHYEGNMSNAAKAGGIAQSAMVYYSRPGVGGRFPSASALAKVLRPFPPSTQAELVVAFVTDLMPEVAKRMVRVESLSTPLRSAPPDRPLLPQEAEDALAVIRQRAAADPAVQRWLVETARIMQGR